MNRRLVSKIIIFDIKLNSSKIFWNVTNWGRGVLKFVTSAKVGGGVEKSLKNEQNKKTNFLDGL